MVKNKRVNKLNKFIKHLIEKRPAPFYLVYFPQKNSVANDLFWSQVISSVEKENEQKNVLEHPDVLWIPLEKKHYQQSELELAQNFLLKKPFSWQRKYIIWEKAEGLTISLTNKLLKDLEEPGENCTIFMGVHNGLDLAPTLLSRAVSYRISHIAPSFSQENAAELAESAKNELLAKIKNKDYSLGQFATENSKNTPLLFELWSFVLLKMAENHRNFLSLQRAREEFILFEQGLKWNHLRKDQLLLLGNYLKKLV